MYIYIHVHVGPFISYTCIFLCLLAALARAATCMISFRLKSLGSLNMARRWHYGTIAFNRDQHVYVYIYIYIYKYIKIQKLQKLQSVPNMNYEYT